MIERADTDAIKVLTAAEVAEQLRLGEDHAEAGDAAAAVRRLVRECGLKPIRGCGRSYKFAQPELNRWIMAETEAFGEKGDKDS